MKDLRFNFKHIQRLAAMCSVVSLIMIAASIAAAQQQPSTESQRPAQRDAQGNSISNDQIIVNTDLVTLTVTVTDSHGRSSRDWTRPISQSATTRFHSRSRSSAMLIRP